jgi:nucleotide-binding universal stress UspA family protein
MTFPYPALELSDMKRILYPTDYSELSEYALHFATSLARDCRAELLIVHVSETECCPVGELFDEECEPSAEELKRLEAVRPDDTSVPFEHRLVCPPPSADSVHLADEIVKLARQEDVHAVVMGTHGRTGLNRLMMGSVAETVMWQAPCPVVTVKKPET